MSPLCPSVADWQRLIAGDVSDADAGVLEAHLDACAVCRTHLPAVPRNDTIRRAFHAGAVHAADNELVAGLVERMKQLLQSSIPSYAAPTEDDPFSAKLRAGQETRIGSCRLLRLLGSGGMGLVFEAIDESLGRRVAVKIMAPKLAASAAARQRFLREAQAVAAIDHPNVVHVYQVGEENGTPFLVMEFLEGETLAQRLQKGRPTIRECAAIGRQIAEGLAAAHERGLIHRDVKPANVFLQKDERNPQTPPSAPTPLSTRVRILDFGLAVAVGGDTRLTRIGDVLGTPAYMSPEQARGERVDARADLFSLGCILYELCTGFTPFQAANCTALLLPSVERWPKPPHELNPAVPASLSRLIVALLAREPEQRPNSAAQVAADCRAIEEGRAWVERKRLPRRAALATLALASAALLIWLGIGLFTPTPLTGSWQRATPLARTRTNTMAAAVDGEIYLVVGVVTGPHLDTLDAFNPATGEWRSLAPLPRTDTGDTGRSGASVGVIDGKLYLVGGWRHKPPLPTQTLLIYDPASNSWKVGPPMPTRCSESVAGVIDRKLYVLVGSNGYDGIRHLFYVYDPDRESWKELQPAPRPHYQAAGGVLGGKLYVVGGNTPTGPTAGLDVYDPATDSWTSRAPTSLPRVGAAAAVFDDRLIIMGGHDGGANPATTVETYNPAADRWTALPDLPEPRRGGAAVVVDAKLYLLGGDHLGQHVLPIDIFTFSCKSR